MSKSREETPANLHRKWFRAVKHNDTEVIGDLLQNGFDIEACNDTQRTALHVAAENNAVDVAILLLRHHANIEAKMSDKGTPLLDAAACGHVEMTLLLLTHGANFAAKDQNEWGVMHWIANEDQLRLIDALCLQRPELISNWLTAKRWNGIAPIHMVSSAHMTKKLIALGVTVDEVTSEYGSTPLIEATEQNQLDIVICLVRHGANILHTNHRHETALDIADRTSAHTIKAFFEETLSKQNNPQRKKTNYMDNRTAALQMRHEGVDLRHIKFHASLRMDLFFFTLIAYYQSKLTIDIEQTNRQHGQGSNKTNTAACHSAILTSLWDTERERSSHHYNTRNAPTVTSYRTGILNGTHFEDSLNLTVELDKAVNYFDTQCIEGKTKTNQKMRAAALNILNDVSSGKYDPIAGMNQFLNLLHRHFLTIQTAYIGHKELVTSPKATRSDIFTAQYKGSFYNTCGFKSEKRAPDRIELHEDYIQAQLPLTKKERTSLRDQPGLFSTRDKKKIYQAAFLRVKQDMDLPVQYQHI